MYTLKLWYSFFILSSLCKMWKHYFDLGRLYTITSKVYLYNGCNTFRTVFTHYFSKTLYIHVVYELCECPVFYFHWSIGSFCFRFIHFLNCIQPRRSCAPVFPPWTDVVAYPGNVIPYAHDNYYNIVINFTRKMCKKNKKYYFFG